MASIFKRKRTETIPAGAVVLERDGRPHAEWCDGKGKPRTAPLNGKGDRVLLPAAKDDPYHVAYEDGNGRRRTRRAYRDKEASDALGRRLEEEAARAKEGLTDPFQQHRQMPALDAVSEWAGMMQAVRAPQMRMHVERIVKGTGADRLHQLDAPAVHAFLASLQRDEGMGDVTYNEYVASIKNLTKWAVVNRRLPFDPLVGLKRIPAKHATAKHGRRALTHDQMSALLKAAADRPAVELRTIRTGPRAGLADADVRPAVLLKAEWLGRQRRLAYLVTYWLRLRRNECIQLEWRDVVLDQEPPCVRLRRETTKAKRGDTVPIHAQLRAELLAHRPANFRPTDRVLKAVPTMRCMKLDLAYAGIDYDDGTGGFADFHALGKSSITAMQAHGVTQRSAQAIARHKDGRMTSRVYTDESLLPLASELAKVPCIPDAGELVGAAHAQRTGDFGGQIVAVGGTTAGVDEGAGGAGERDADGAQVVAGRAVGTKGQGPAPCGTGPWIEAGERGRTVDIHVGNVTLYH